MRVRLARAIACSDEVDVGGVDGVGHDHYRAFAHVVALSGHAELVGTREEGEAGCAVAVGDGLDDGFSLGVDHFYYRACYRLGAWRGVGGVPDVDYNLAVIGGGVGEGAGGEGGGGESGHERHDAEDFDYLCDTSFHVIVCYLSLCWLLFYMCC